MIKLCIIETENHHEVIRSIVQSLHSLSYSITIISHAKCIPFLSNLNDCTMIDYNEADFDTFSHFKEYNYDRILFVTPPPFKSTDFKFLYARSYLLIHNIHFWTNPWGHLFFWLKPKKQLLIHFLKWLKYLPDSTFKRKRFLKSFDKILVPSSFIYSAHTHNVDDYIDLRFPHLLAKSDKKSPFTIVLPGTLNSSRNYTQLINTINQIANENQLNIDLELLGRGNIDNFDTGDYLNVISYPKGLDSKCFDKTISGADMGILHVEQNKSYKGILEQKGKSNISGAINDFYRYNIPALIPAFYPIDKSLGLFQSYDSNTIDQLLKEWVTDGAHKLYKEAFTYKRTALSEQVSSHNHKVLSK